MSKIEISGVIPLQMDGHYIDADCSGYRDTTYIRIGPKSQEGLSLVPTIAIDVEDMFPFAARILRVQCSTNQGITLEFDPSSAIAGKSLLVENYTQNAISLSVGGSICDQYIPMSTGTGRAYFVQFRKQREA